MNLGMDASGYEILSIPRVSGDEPGLVKMTTGMFGYSPRERG